MNKNIWAITPQALEDIHREKMAFLQNAQLLNAVLSEKEKPLLKQENVAVINIEGAIYRKKAWYMQGTTHKQIKADIEKALQDSDVQAIIYNIYSPGGTVAGTQELAAVISEASKKKPSCAFVDGMACSAAYWLASATGKIYATESAELGSIGVILTHADYSKINENLGLKYTHITAGSKKNIGSSDLPLSETDKAYLQNQVNGMYAVFLQEVAQNMGLNIENKLGWADGQVFLGKEAKSLGLITNIVKTKEEAISLLLSTNKEQIMNLNTQNLNTHDQTPQTSSQAVLISDDLFAMIETVCGQENAQKVKALAESGVNQKQLEALGAVFSFAGKAEKKEDTDAQNQAMPAGNEQILSALIAASPEAVTNATNLTGNLSSDEQNLISRLAKI